MESDSASRQSISGRTLAIGIVVGAAVLLAIGAAIGSSARSGAVDQQRRRAVADEQQINSLHSQLTGDESQIASLQSNASDDQATIDAQSSQIAGYKQQQTTLTKRSAQLDQRQAQLDQQAQTQQLQADQLNQQQAAVDANSFSDGLFQVGVDIQPGQYHTAGEANCYWSKLSSSDTSSYIDNNLSSGPQTVTVDSPYFDSDGCGTWTKVG